MLKFNKFVSLLAIVSSSVFLLGWGNNGHKIIAGNLQFFINKDISSAYPNLTSYVLNHSSDPDYRKNTDTSESPKHFINLENFPGFSNNRNINKDINSYDYSFLKKNGLLPWAIESTVESLTSAFKANNANLVSKFSADLSHYVADLNMPLHTTKNYDGYYTNQAGVHSRYESDLIEKYQGSIYYLGSEQKGVIDTLKNYVFAELFKSFDNADSILSFDKQAFQVVGNRTSDAFYAEFWKKASYNTINSFKNSTKMLAELMNTAYYNSKINSVELADSNFVFVYPTIIADKFKIEFQMPNSSKISAAIYNSKGEFIISLIDKKNCEPNEVIEFETNSLAEGIYFAVINVNGQQTSKKIIVLKN